MNKECCEDKIAISDSFESEIYFKLQLAEKEEELTDKRFTLEDFEKIINEIISD